MPRSCHCPRHLKRKATRGSVWQQYMKWCSHPARRNAMSCLAMSCPLERHHGRYSKGPPQSWRRAVMAHCNRGSADGERLNWSKRFWNLATPTLRTFRTSECLPSTQKKKHRSSTQKLHKNLMTPTANTTVQRDICGNKKHMPWNKKSSHVKTVACRDFASAAAPASPTLLMLRFR